MLREEKGYTYGMRASFRPRRREGLFLVSGSVRADATVEALGLLLGHPGARPRRASPPEETRAGVDFIHKTAPGRYATADAVADEAAAMALEGLTDRVHHRQPARPGDGGRRAALRGVQPFVTGDWTVVVVGDAARFADGVRGLGRGDVTVVPA